MSLVQDLDLARLEPSLFRNAQAAGVVLHEAESAAIDDFTLTSAASNFTEADETRIALIGDSLVEIVAVTGADTATVSRVRPGDGDLIMPTANPEATLRLLTFEPLLAQAEAEIRRVLRLGDDQEGPGAVADDAALNLEDVGHLIALTAAARAFAIAAAHDPVDVSLAERAQLFDQLASAARRRLTLLIDRDGDGVADATRPLLLVQLTRS